MHVNSELAASIRVWAKGLGFEQCGFADPAPSAFRAEFLHWLESGRHAGMHYMAKDPERRLDPQLVLEGVQSIVVVSMNYATAPSPPHPSRPKFARYAQNVDYHDVMTPRLSELLRRIQEQEPSVQGKVYVDTGPILEREVAQRAGLGWIGKNTMLIHPKLGSWFLLGVILLNVPLPFDEPIQHSCGKCTRCLDACPTQAFVGPWQLDANRCISYHTIESREPIPDEIAANLNEWVFGCDICQEVCPFNFRWEHHTKEPAFQPREALNTTFEELSQLNEEQFREQFRGSPVKRTKWKGLIRNVESAMRIHDDGNS